MITPLIGPNGKISILIRDDDTNFFTKSKMLEKIYTYAWKNQFKTSLSIIPYQKGINDVCVPPNFRKSDKYYSLEENKELCLFLQEKIKQNHVELIQHGVSHVRLDSRGEFSFDFNKHNGINRILKELENKYFNSFKITNFEEYNKLSKNGGIDSYIDIGKDIIKKSIGITPTLFAPPYDDIFKLNITLLLNQNVIPIYGQLIYHKFFRSTFISHYIKKYLAKKIIKKFENIGFIIPFILSNTDYYNVQNQGLMLYPPKRPKRNPFSNNKKEYQPFVDWVSTTISHCIEHRTPICILNHYHHYFYDWNFDTITRKNLFDQWKKILSLLNNIPFSWKTSFLKLYERIMQIKMIQILKSGSKITINSTNQSIENISFKVDNSLKFEKNENILADKKNELIITIKKLEPNTKCILYTR